MSMIISGSWEVWELGICCVAGVEKALCLPSLCPFHVTGLWSTCFRRGYGERLLEVGTGQLEDAGGVELPVGHT